MAAASSFRQNEFTLKEQQELVSNLQNENYELKMKIYHLEEDRERNTPQHILLLFSENAELKSSVHKLEVENQILKQSIHEIEKDRANSALQAIEKNKEPELRLKIIQLEQESGTLREQIVLLNEKQIDSCLSLKKVTSELHLALINKEALTTETALVRSEIALYKKNNLNFFTNDEIKNDNNNKTLNDEQVILSSELNNSLVQQSTKHMKAQIDALRLVLDGRTKEVEELQRKLGVLTRQIRSNHGNRIDLYSPLIKSSSTPPPTILASPRSCSPHSIQQQDVTENNSLKLQLESMRVQLEVSIDKISSLSYQLENRTASHEQAALELAQSCTEKEEKYILDLKKEKKNSQSLRERVNVLEERILDLQGVKDKVKIKTNLDKNKSYLKNELLHKDMQIRDLKADATARTIRNTEMLNELILLKENMSIVRAGAQFSSNEIKSQKEELIIQYEKRKKIEVEWRLALEKKNEIESREEELKNSISKANEDNEKHKLRIQFLEKQKLIERNQNKSISSLSSYNSNVITTLAEDERISLRQQLDIIETSCLNYQKIIGILKHSLKEKEKQITIFKENEIILKDKKNKNYNLIELEEEHAKLICEHKLISSEHEVLLELSKQGSIQFESDGFIRKIHSIVIGSLGKPKNTYETSEQLKIQLEEGINELNQIKLRSKDILKEEEKKWREKLLIINEKLDRYRSRFELCEKLIQQSLNHLRYWKSKANMAKQSLYNNSENIEKTNSKIIATEAELEKIGKSEAILDEENKFLRQEIEEIKNQLCDKLQDLEISRKLNSQYLSMIAHHKKIPNSTINRQNTRMRPLSYEVGLLYDNIKQQQQQQQNSETSSLLNQFENQK